MNSFTPASGASLAFRALCRELRRWTDADTTPAGRVSLRHSCDCCRGGCGGGERGGHCMCWQAAAAGQYEHGSLAAEA